MSEPAGTSLVSIVPETLPRRVFDVSVWMVGAGVFITLGAGFVAPFVSWTGEDSRLPQLILFSVAGLATSAVGAGGIAWARAVEGSRARAAERQARLQQSQAVVVEQGEVPRVSWDVAVVKLESYLDRNLSQVDAIFKLATTVMVAGFILISGGVLIAFLDSGGVETLSDQAEALFGSEDEPVAAVEPVPAPEPPAEQASSPSVSPPAFVSPTDPAVEDEGSLSIAMISAAAGVLVEFIGATLMVIYRSTMSQAERYMRVLERINAVGMSMQIVGSIKDDPALHNKGLVMVAERMLAMYSEAPVAATSPATADPLVVAPDVTVG